MVLIFYERDDKDASKKFWERADHNPSGFFINCRGARGPMLHQVGCEQVRKEEYLHNIAKKKKVCSPDRRELKQWARSMGEELHKCDNCL